jgi:hypothetical protein
MSLRSPAKNRVLTSAVDTVELLEDRKLMAASPAQIIGIKIAKRQDVDATALNSNRITIAFQYPDKSAAALRVVDASKFRTFGYSNDLVNPALQRKVGVGLTVQNGVDGTGVLTITTDRLIRKGSRLQILPGALTDSKGRTIVFDASTAASTITFTVGQNKPRYTLANRNFRPTDLSYFSPDIFSSAPTPTTASVVPSASSVRTSLVAFMNAKVTQGKLTVAKRDAAIALFDDAGYSSLIPNPALRAGLASLYGTVAEPAIGSYIGRANVTGKAYTFIRFDSSISAGAPIGETKVSENGRLLLTIRPTFAGEDFRALSAVLAHEAIHQDTAAASGAQGVPPNSQDEEIVTNAIQSTVYIQQALVDSSFVGNGTKLVNQINDQVLALINSGDKLFPYGGIQQAPALNSNANVFPGAKTDPGNFNNNTTVKSFADFIRREYVFRGFSSGGTASNPTATAILQNIVGTNTNLTVLGTKVQEYLDIQNVILTDATYIKMAQILKLNF